MSSPMVKGLEKRNNAPNILERFFKGTHLMMTTLYPAVNKQLLFTRIKHLRPIRKQKEVCSCFKPHTSLSS